MSSSRVLTQNKRLSFARHVQLNTDLDGLDESAGFNNKREKVPLPGQPNIDISNLWDHLEHEYYSKDLENWHHIYG